MPMFSDETRGLIKGIAIGLGATLLIKEVYPSLRPAVRPLAKAGIRTGMQLVESSQVRLARIGEHVEDLIAEIEAERTEERAAADEQSPSVTPTEIEVEDPIPEPLGRES